MLIPKGILLKQYRPKGVMNVVSSFYCSVNGFCQNPLFASSLLNILAPVSNARFCQPLVVDALLSKHCYYKRPEIHTYPDIPILLGSHDHASTPWCRNVHF